jgi:hypothetical protein
MENTEPSAAHQRRNLSQVVENVSRLDVDHGVKAETNVDGFGGHTRELNAVQLHISHVFVPEALTRRQDVIEPPRLVTAGRLEGVAVHGSQTQATGEDERRQRDQLAGDRAQPAAVRPPRLLIRGRPRQVAGHGAEPVAAVVIARGRHGKGGPDHGFTVPS